MDVDATQAEEAMEPPQSPQTPQHASDAPQCFLGNSPQDIYDNAIRRIRREHLDVIQLCMKRAKKIKASGREGYDLRYSRVDDDLDAFLRKLRGKFHVDIPEDTFINGWDNPREALKPPEMSWEEFKRIDRLEKDDVESELKRLLRDAEALVDAAAALDLDALFPLDNDVSEDDVWDTESDESEGELLRRRRRTARHRARESRPASRASDRMQKRRRRRRSSSSTEASAMSSEDSADALQRATAAPSARRVADAGTFVLARPRASDRRSSADVPQSSAPPPSAPSSPSLPPSPVRVDGADVSDEVSPASWRPKRIRLHRRHGLDAVFENRIRVSVPSRRRAESPPRASLSVSSACAAAAVLAAPTERGVRALAVALTHPDAAAAAMRCVPLLLLDARADSAFLGELAALCFAHRGRAGWHLVALHLLAKRARTSKRLPFVDAWRAADANVEVRCCLSVHSHAHARNKNLQRFLGAVLDKDAIDVAHVLATDGDAAAPPVVQPQPVAAKPAAAALEAAEATWSLVLDLAQAGICRDCWELVEASVAAMLSSMRRDAAEWAALLRAQWRSDATSRGYVELVLRRAAALRALWLLPAPNAPPSLAGVLEAVAKHLAAGPGSGAVPEPDALTRRLVELARTELAAQVSDGRRLGLIDRLLKTTPTATAAATADTRALLVVLCEHCPPSESGARLADKAVKLFCLAQQRAAGMASSSLAAECGALCLCLLARGKPIASADRAVELLPGDVLADAIVELCDRFKRSAESRAAVKAALRDGLGVLERVAAAEGAGATDILLPCVRAVLHSAVIPSQMAECAMAAVDVLRACIGRALNLAANAPPRYVARAAAAAHAPLPPPPSANEADAEAALDAYLTHVEAVELRRCFERQLDAWCAQQRALDWTAARACAQRLAQAFVEQRLPHLILSCLAAGSNAAHGAAAAMAQRFAVRAAEMAGWTASLLPSSALPALWDSFGPRNALWSASQNAESVAGGWLAQVPCCFARGLLAGWRAQGIVEPSAPVRDDGVNECFLLAFVARPDLGGAQGEHDALRDVALYFYRRGGVGGVGGGGVGGGLEAIGEATPARFLQRLGDMLPLVRDARAEDVAVAIEGWVARCTDARDVAVRLPPSSRAWLTRADQDVFCGPSSAAEWALVNARHRLCFVLWAAAVTRLRLGENPVAKHHADTLFPVAAKWLCTVDRQQRPAPPVDPAPFWSHLLGQRWRANFTPQPGALTRLRRDDARAAAAVAWVAGAEPPDEPTSLRALAARRVKALFMT